MFAVSDLLSTGPHLGQVPDGVSTMLPVEMEENEAATQIQRIARGRQARKAVERRRRRYNRAATRIQARARGMRDRNLVLGLRRKENAATEIQRMARGKLARREVKEMKLSNLHNTSAQIIQATLRGHFGRKRMRAKRGMAASSRLGKEAADALKPKVCSSDV